MEIENNEFAAAGPMARITLTDICTQGSFNAVMKG